jgi:hypothetical protein
MEGKRSRFEQKLRKYLPGNEEKKETNHNHNNFLPPSEK